MDNKNGQEHFLHEHHSMIDRCLSCMCDLSLFRRVNDSLQ